MKPKSDSMEDKPADKKSTARENEEKESPSPKDTMVNSVDGEQLASAKVEKASSEQDESEIKSFCEKGFGSLADIKKFIREQRTEALESRGEDHWKRKQDSIADAVVEGIEYSTDDRLLAWQVLCAMEGPGKWCELIGSKKDRRRRLHMILSCSEDDLPELDFGDEEDLFQYLIQVLRPYKHHKKNSLHAFYEDLRHGEVLLGILKKWKCRDEFYRGWVAFARAFQHQRTEGISTDLPQGPNLFQALFELINKAFAGPRPKPLAADLVKATLCFAAYFKELQADTEQLRSKKDRHEKEILKLKVDNDNLDKQLSETQEKVLAGEKELKECGNELDQTQSEVRRLEALLLDQKAGFNKSMQEALEEQRTKTLYALKVPLSNLRAFAERDKPNLEAILFQLEELEQFVHGMENKSKT